MSLDCSMREEYGSMLSLEKSCDVGAEYDELVMILMAFFCSFSILLKLDLLVRLIMDGQYVRCEWKRAKYNDRRALWGRMFFTLFIQ